MLQTRHHRALACVVLPGCWSLVACQPEVAAVLPPLERDEVAGSSYAATVQRTPGLIAYFRFSEPSGTVARDRVDGLELVTQNPAVLGGEGAIPNDPEHGEARFDGDATSRFGMPFPESFELRSRELSLELWLKLGGIAPTCRQPSHPAAKMLWVPGILGGFWGLTLSGSEGDALGFQVHLDLEQYQVFEAVTPDGTLRRPNAPDCAADSWQHLVATVDLGADEEHLKVYVDGRLAGNSDSHPLTISGVTDEVAISGLELEPRLELGGTAPGNDDGVILTGEPFSGSLDELAVYSRALDATEVAEHYAAASR